MNTKRSNTPVCLCAVALLAAAPLAAAQVNDLDMRLPMDINADNTSIDGKNSMIIFSGLTLTQGDVSIQADEGRATRMELEDASWNFTGNVIIKIGAGHIDCDTAELLFDDFLLRQAIVVERHDDKSFVFEAGRLNYDVDAGVIEFSEQATIIEGGNQISSNMLVYNITEQRINADSTGEEDDRVRITYTPANGIESPDGDSEATESEDENQ